MNHSVILVKCGAPHQWFGFGTSVTWSLETISEILNGPLPMTVSAFCAQTSGLVVSLDENDPPAAFSTMSWRMGAATHRVTTHLKNAAGCWSLITNVLSSGAESPRPDTNVSIALALETSTLP